MAKTLNYEVSLGDLSIAIGDRKLSEDELLKQKYGILGGEELRNQLENASRPDVDEEVHIHLKPHGVYIQFDRALAKQKIKDWFFMVRSSIWGGGDITAQQWLEYNRLAELFSSDEDGSPSLRLTTRQSIQFHRVRKNSLLLLIQGIIDNGRATLNGCGDNVRNIIACPHKSDVFDINVLAQKIGSYFQLPLSEHYKVFDPGRQVKINGEKKFEYDRQGLPRKFKIGIGGYYFDENKNEYIHCNCADILSNDVGIVPVVKENKLTGYQVYLGGGLGQKNGKLTFATLGVPFAKFENENDLMIGLDAIVKVQQQVGDRENRHWSRLKNVLIKKGLEGTGNIIEDVVTKKIQLREIMIEGAKWYQEQVKSLGIEFSQPEEMNIGELNRHHGWSKQFNGKYSFGLWIQNGRITDTNPQGKIKSLIEKIVNSIKLNIRITPYQDILFTDIPEEDKHTLEKILSEFNYGSYTALRVLSQACVGLNTCSIAVAESERYFHPLLSELENNGYGNIDGVSIGLSGCERHCSRNVRHDICIEGKGSGIYQIKLLLGKSDDGLAEEIISDGKKYLRSVPQNEIPTVIKKLLDNFLQSRFPGETLSEFHLRIGMEEIINTLTGSVETAHLMQKTFDALLV